jgi:hypothetical protein
VYKKKKKRGKKARKDVLRAWISRIDMENKALEEKLADIACENMLKEENKDTKGCSSKRSAAEVGNSDSEDAKKK